MYKGKIRCIKKYQQLPEELSTINAMTCRIGKILEFSALSKKTIKRCNRNLKKLTTENHVSKTLLRK